MRRFLLTTFLLLNAIFRPALADGPVYFADPQLKAAVEMVLGVSDPNAQEMLHLEVLSAEEMGISSLEGLQYAKNLHYLILFSNQISDVSALSGLTNLYYLDMSNNQLTNIFPLSGLTNLYYLELISNQISDISALSGLVNLQKLYLSYNQLTNISLSGLTKLIILDLANNPINSISLTDLTSLPHLHMHNGTLIEVCLSGLTSLTSLDLANNPINSISLTDLTSLPNLYMDNGTLIEVCLSGLTSLRELHLDGNRIVDISLSGLTNLQVLYLSSNQLTNISPLSGLTNLQVLYLSYNQLTNISPLSSLTNLDVLVLTSNQITNISPLSSLTNLSGLILYENQISDINSLSGLTNLQGLGLQENQISDISALSGLTNLRGLALGWNQISDISALSGLTNLQGLGLQENQISDISALSGLTYLQYLWLARNQISDISALSGLTNLKELYLEHNPLDCKAYSYYIPLIINNNPGLHPLCDPRPLWCEGSLSGIVYDSNTGNPIADADVNIPETPVEQTDQDGSFHFDDVNAGQITVSAAKDGYYDKSEVVTISQYSTTFVSIALTPLMDFGIVEVRGIFCGPDKHAYYLNNISLNETFTATIDWNGLTPYQVKWILPSGPIVDSISDPNITVSRQFNMGSDFGEGGKLKVIAVADKGAIESPEYVVNFDVMSIPPIANLVPAVFYEAVQTGEGFEYRILGLTGLKLDLANWDATKVTSSIPIFGGQEMNIGLKLADNPGPFSGTLAGTVDSDGKAKLFTVGWNKSYKKKNRKGVRCEKGIKLPFTEVAPNASLEFDFKWSKALNEWKPGGDLNLGCDFKYSSPQIPLGAIVIVPIYLRAEISLDLDLTIGVSDWTAVGPQWHGNFQFEPLAKGILGAGIAGVACVEGYLGGGFHSGITFIPKVEWTNTYIILVGGVQATLGPFTAGPLELRYEWPEQKSMVSVTSMDALLRTTEWQLLPRDYLNYEKEKTESLQLLDVGILGAINEQPIETAVFPYSVPDVVKTDTGILAVWIADDTSRSLINRTELTFANYDGSVWTTPSAIADDGTADMNPQLVKLSNGDAVCIWQDADAVLSDFNDIDDFKSHLEIAISTYDNNLGSWSTEEHLTNNSVFDRSQRLSATSSSNMIAVWISNPNNDTWGSDVNTNNIMYSSYNGISWSEPNIISTGFGTILDTTLAYDGMTGTFVFCTDADNNFDTPEDQELWATTYSGGSWTIPTQLTNDANTDSSPRLVYDSLGTLYMAWIRDNDIRFTNGTDVGSSTVVVTPGASMSSKDFDLVIGDNDQIALVWNDVSETYNDLFVSYYEPTMGTWSKPRQLTSDDSAERFISGTFDPNNNLFCVYDKTQTEYEDRIVDVNGQQVVVEGVPKAGQSDLYYLSYTLQTDLSITVEDVDILPPNPAPDSNAIIIATIKNLGESPASDVNVAFYEGDPCNGGILIDSVQTITGPINGGEDANVSINWTVPDTNSPIEIYAVVDPCMAQEDRNWSNNTAVVKVLAPDLTIKEIIVQRAGRKHIVTARIANEGVLTAGIFEVVIRLDEPNDSNDPILDGYHLFEILPGAYHDVSFTLSSLPVGVVNVYLSLDENELIDEISDDNNQRSVRIINYAPGDFEPDGDVDRLDLRVFASEWLLSGDNLISDIYPFDGDGVVNSSDYAEFANYWLSNISP